MDGWRRIIVIRSKESSGSQNPNNLGQGRRWFHPVERLGSRNNIRAPIRQARLLSQPLSILNLCRVGRVPGFAYGLVPHISIGFDPNHPLSPLAPDRGGRPVPAAPTPPPGGL